MIRLLKAILKFFLYSILGIISLVLIFVAFIYFRGIPSYEVKKLEVTVESTPERVERGKKLATVLCAGCHLDPNTMALTGKQMLDAPPEFGPIFSQNITQDKTLGIGEWTDGEIVTLLRTGINREGRYTPPYMAKLPHMADEDINSIVAFLRSDENMVKAQAIEDKPCEPSLLTKFLCFVAFKPLPMPMQEIPMPDTNNAVALGKYLTHNLDCFTCHSADFKTLNILEPEKTPGYLGGGNKPLNMQGKVMITPNITPDMETGIGGWTKDQFVNAVRWGKKEGETSLRYPMMPYTNLTDKEVLAIFEYLKTVPPIKNKVVRSL